MPRIGKINITTEETGRIEERNRIFKIRDTREENKKCPKDFSEGVRGFLEN